MHAPIAVGGRESAGARSGLHGDGVAQASTSGPSRDLRRRRLLGREVLQAFTSLDRLRFCGMPAGQTVHLRYSGAGAAGVAGLASCGYVWSCPCCSAKISRARADDMEQAIRTWVNPRYRAILGKKHDGAFVLLTLTLQHRAGEALADLWDAVSDSWRYFVSARQYKRWARAARVVGYHRTTEVTHGANGWHVHLHVLFFLDKPVSPVVAPYAGRVLVDHWLMAVNGMHARDVKRVIKSHGLVAAQTLARPVARALYPSASLKGQDFKVMHGDADALSTIAGYVHKNTYHEGPTSPRAARSLALEISRSDLKVARAGASRTPFAILGSLVALMLEDGTVNGSPDWALWSEWEEASKGRRQQVWSRGLRDMLCLGAERSDEEIASEDLEGTDVVAIDADDWVEFAAAGGRVADLLGVMERAQSPREAAYRARAMLMQYGVPHRVLVGDTDDG